VLRRASLARLLARLRQTTGVDAPAREALLRELAVLAENADLTDVEAAELSLERWRLTATAPDHDRAVHLARLAFASEPSATVFGWLNELGASAPTSPTALPPPVGIGRTRSTRRQLDAAFSRLEAALGEVANR
jgi:hypothetical protein